MRLLGRLLYPALLSPMLLVSTPALSKPEIQPLAMPMASQYAKASQTVGMSRVGVRWFSPVAKGRKIFGELVPYDKLWRSGANGATILKFKSDVTISGTKVPAGKYSFFTIPGASEWTLILNKDTTLAGTHGYKESEDLLRIKVKPEQIPHREALTYIFSNTTQTETRLDLEWATTRVSLPIQVDTAEVAKAKIAEHAQRNAGELLSVARYYASELKDLDRALATVELSIGLEETWLALWMKASWIAEKGDKKAALPFAERAWELGNQSGYFFFKGAVQKALEEWKK